MAIDHRKLRYSPTLRLRTHEMRALEQLFDNEKDQLLPTILIRPWTTAKSITKGMERIDKALDGRPFCVDLDPLYQMDTGAPEAIEEIQGYYASYSNWYEFVKERENCIPYLRFDRGAPDLNSRRLQWVRERGFGIALRHPFAELPAVNEVIEEIDHSNFFVNVDAGWDTDILLRQAVVNNTVRSLAEANPLVKIVVTSSTFPESFDGVGIDDTHQLNEINLFESAANAVRQSSNTAETFYGDWATTRHPFGGGGNINTSYPRIDVPKDRTIQMFREPPPETESVHEVYERLAETVMASEHWPTIPACWGKYIIDLTASGSQGGIRMPAMNVSPRINMHIHRQLARLSDVPSDGIEEYED